LTFKFRTLLLGSLLVSGLSAVSALSAATITVQSAGGVFHGATPGNPANAGLIAGDGTAHLTWGVQNTFPLPIGTDPQSGFLLEPEIPPPVVHNVPPSPTPWFPVARFTHENWQVGDLVGNAFGTLGTDLTVDLTLDVDGVPAAPSFLYTLSIEETSNPGSDAGLPGCPYGGTPAAASGGRGITGCDDKVTIATATPFFAFSIGGVDYLVELRFVDGASLPVSEFITQEFQNNVGHLEARIFAVTSEIPEPQTVVLTGLGGVLLLFTRRRR
jgi:hypothetical protein